MAEYMTAQRIAIGIVWLAAAIVSAIGANIPFAVLYVALGVRFLGAGLQRLFHGRGMVRPGKEKEAAAGGRLCVLPSGACKTADPARRENRKYAAVFFRNTR